mgnify:CR=1 FL=1
MEPEESILKIVKIFKKEKIKRVLDLGCGSGRHLVYFAKQGFNVYGIDIAKTGIEMAKDWLKEEKLKANLEIGDIYKKLPYKDNFFEAIICTNVLHHNKIEKIRKLIKEMERILVPRGFIYIVVRKAIGVKNWKKDKIVIHRYKIKDKVKEVKYKIIGHRIYVPIEGGEKGLIHFCFNKKLIQKEFENFKIFKFWVARGHYYFLGRLKSKNVKS